MMRQHTTSAQQEILFEEVQKRDDNGQGFFVGSQQPQQLIDAITQAKERHHAV